MGFTLVAYSQSIDAATLSPINPVTDQHVRVEGKNIVVPDYNNVLAAYVLGANVTGAQLDAPSLRASLLADLNPLDRAALPSIPHRYYNRLDNPIVLEKSEQLRLNASEDAVGASQVTGLVWLGDGPRRRETRPFMTVRVDASGTAAAFTWSLFTLTFSQALRAGTYAVVGAEGRGANLIAFRFVFAGYPWRPGALGKNAETGFVDEAFRYGNLGIWGTFTHNVPPQIEVFASAADTSATLYIDLVKLS